MRHAAKRRDEESTPKQPFVGLRVANPAYGSVFWPLTSVTAQPG